MNFRPFFRPVFVALAALLSSAAACPAAQTVQLSLRSGGIDHTYLLHVPASYRPGRAAPLVLVIHGSGGTGKSMEDVTGFSAIADAAGFLVAYPDATGNQWFDPSGHETPGSVVFIAALLDATRATYTIDRSRIYCTGMSQGGGMSYLLASELPGRFAAIAPVVGGLPIGTDIARFVDRPMPVMLFNGTADAIVPYFGGTVGAGPLKVMSTPELAGAFAAYDGCSPWPAFDWTPDWAWWDGCRALRTTFSGGVQGSEVILYTITGGGHTWPGSRIWLPAFVFGATCYDVDATSVIWEFFVRHQLPASPAN